MSEFKGVNAMTNSTDIIEVDVTEEMDITTKTCISEIVKFLGDVKVIRSTHRNLTTWLRGGIFVDVLTEAEHVDKYVKVDEMVEKYFGVSDVEPVSLMCVNNIDTEIVAGINEGKGINEIYILYRR